MPITKFFHIAYVKHWRSALFTLTGLAIIAAHAILAYWSFPQDDDFRLAACAQHLGLVGCVLSHYQTWSGRIFGLFLSGFIGTTSVFPYHTNVVLIAGVILFAMTIALLFLVSDGKYSSVIWLDVGYFMLVMPRNVKIFNFYWLNGFILYLLPISIACLYVCLTTGHRRSENTLKEIGISLTSALLFFVLSMFNEQLSVAIILCISLYLLGHHTPLSLHRWLPIMGGCCVGLLIDGLAPGNFQRIASSRMPREWDTLLKYALDDIMGYSAFFFYAFCYGCLRAYLYPSSFKRLHEYLNAKWVPHAILLVIIPCNFMVVYCYNSPYMPGTAVLVPFSLAFLGGLFFASYIIKILASSTESEKVKHYKTHTIKNLAYRLYLLLPLLFITSAHVVPAYKLLVSSIDQGPAQRDAALAQMDAALNEQDKSTLNIYSIPDCHSLLCMRVLADNPYAYKNIAFAYYFGFKEVIAYEPIQ